jgi:hypothetical protein
MTNMARFLTILLLISVSACVAPSRDGRKPVAKRTAPSPEIRQCLADLNSLKAKFAALPEQDFGNGCSIKGAVSLSVAAVPVTNVKAIRCPAAKALTQWVASDVQAAAVRHFGSRVARIETMGSYSCRRVIGNGSGRISEHASANAIDIGGFVLTDGRRVTVEAGWSGARDERSFLRDVRNAGCRRFQTVLSPDYNAAHYNHLHFDMGRGPFCR